MPSGPAKLPTARRPASASVRIVRCSSRAVATVVSSSRLPPGQDDDPIARLLHVSDDVGGEDGRSAATPDVGGQGGEEVPSGERIKARERLVEQKQRRPRPERQRQPDLGLLPTRQLRPSARPTALTRSSA